MNQASSVDRKKLPRRNVIEKKLMSDYLHGFTRFSRRISEQNSQSQPDKQKNSNEKQVTNEKS